MGWRKKYGGIIINQLKRLGSSCDWSRERFTMDEGLFKAVRKVFAVCMKKTYLPGRLHYKLVPSVPYSTG